MNAVIFYFKTVIAENNNSYWKQYLLHLQGFSYVTIYAETLGYVHVEKWK